MEKYDELANYLVIERFRDGFTRRKYFETLEEAEERVSLVRTWMRNPPGDRGGSAPEEVCIYEKAGGERTGLEPKRAET